MGKAKKRDRWGRDRDTGAEGLESGIRRVRNGGVKIGCEYWYFVKGRGSWEKHEGKDVEVSCRDAWATGYIARDIDTFQTVGYLTTKGQS
jgi:hypothetical protein